MRKTKFFDATKDFTEKDRILENYYQLQSKSFLNKIEKEQKKNKLKNGFLNRFFSIFNG